jgi:hypothetical protein
VSHDTLPGRGLFWHWCFLVHIGAHQTRRKQKKSDRNENTMITITKRQSRAIHKVMTHRWVMEKFKTFYPERSQYSGNVDWNIVKQDEDGHIRVECKGETKHVDTVEIVGDDVKVTYLPTEKREEKIEFGITPRGLIYNPY